MHSILRGALRAILLAGVAGAAAACSSTQDSSAEQARFTTPEAAIDSFIGALRASDLTRLSAIFGPDSDALVSSGDAASDRAARERFLEKYSQSHRLEKVSDEQVVLRVGEEDWPLPIPVVKVEDGWVFDTDEGMEEILDRRIGRNELNVINVCLAFADAEREYALNDWDGDGILEYAQVFVSSKGKKDGLYWEVGPGEKPSPLGPLVGQAVREGYDAAAGQPSPYHGYYYRILKGQGPGAQGGEYDYVVNGSMIGGFALVAYPADYGASGIMTFIVNHDGVIYQKDLGEKTQATAEAMTRFDPDSSWSKSDDRR